MSFRGDIENLDSLGRLIAQNKVINFSYDDYAYTNDAASGVAQYDYNNHNNIPVANPTLLGINDSTQNKGFRSVVSTMTRMLVNHFFGRVSYNLNKTADMLSELFTAFNQYLGKPDGIATLDENGRIPYSQLPLSAVEYKGTYNAANDTPMLSTGRAVRTYAGLSSFASKDIYVSGTDHGLLTSQDGKAWNKSPGSLGAYSILSIASSGNLHVISVLYHGLYWSTDWVNWTAMTTASMRLWSFQYVTYENGMWMACSQTHGICTSSDGKNWTQVSGDISSYTVDYVLYAGDENWIAGVEAGGIWFSKNNGQTWTQVQGTMQSVYKILTASLTGGRNVYVAVSRYGIWYSSGNLNTWSRSTQFQNKQVNDVAYGNNLFVAAMETGLAWSEDGQNWTQCTGGTSYFFKNVAYADGIWVAGSQSHGLWWSADGKDWVQGTGNTSDTYNTVAYARGIWTAGSQVQGLWWSTDGKDWSDTPGSFGDEYRVSNQGTQNLGEGSITYRPGDRIIFNGSVWQRIPTSDVRTVNTVSPDSEGNVNVTASVMTTPTVKGIDRSKAGESWYITDITSQSIIDVIYVDGKYIAAISTNPSASPYTLGGIFTSTDGRHWTQKLRVDLREGKIAYGNGICVLVWHTSTTPSTDKSCKISYSLDNGETWTNVSDSDLPVSRNTYSPCSVVYADGIFVAGFGEIQTGGGSYWNQYGKLLWSEDGATWIAGLSDSRVLDVTYVNGIWLAATGTGMVTSTDGKTWTSVSGAPSSCYCVQYTGNLWIALKAIQNGSYSQYTIYTSNDGTTWTSRFYKSVLDGSLAQSRQAIIFTGDAWLVALPIGVYRSIDGITWEQPESLSSIIGRSYIAFGAHTCLLSNYLSGMYKSTDSGLTWSRVSGVSASFIFYINAMWLSARSSAGTYWSEGAETNNVQAILDWLLYVADKQYLS